MEGWISLHRKFLDWEWYDDLNTKSLFIHCLLKANNNDKQWRGVIIKRGQFFTSTGNLSNELGLSIKQVRTSLNKLELTGEVKTEGASKGTMLTVCNYDTYQTNSKPKGQAEGQARGKQRATTNNNNKHNNIIDRQNEFKKEVRIFSETYSRDILQAFYNYWSEPTKKKDRMRYELEKTWDTSRRLSTWFNRSKK